jgi:hypothetical protein
VEIELMKLGTKHVVIQVAMIEFRSTIQGFSTRCSTNETFNVINIVGEASDGLDNGVEIGIWSISVKSAISS